MAYESKPVSGAQQSRSRPFTLFAKDFSSVEQAQPLNLGYGIIRSSGTAITPIWNFKAIAQQSSGGGK